MTSTQTVRFSEHCEDCGGVFTVDQLERAQDSFRLHVAIENTGEHGTLTLMFDHSRVFLFDADGADRWTRSYSWLREQDRVSREVYRRTTATVGIRATDERLLPCELPPGDTWEGWFESTQPLPENAVGMIAYIGAFREEVPDRLMFHVSHDAKRPFISLKGQDVVAKPLSPPVWLAAKVVGAFKPQLNLCNLGVFVGGFIGATVDWLTLGVGFVGLFAGMVAGYQAARWYVIARNRRPRVQPPSEA